VEFFRVKMLTATSTGDIYEFDLTGVATFDVGLDLCLLIIETQQILLVSTDPRHADDL